MLYWATLALHPGVRERDRSHRTGSGHRGLCREGGRVGAGSRGGVMVRLHMSVGSHFVTPVSLTSQICKGLRCISNVVNIVAPLRDDARLHALKISIQRFQFNAFNAT